MDALDGFLSRVTTYRLARNGLGFLALVSIIAAFFGLLPYTALQLTLSLVVLLAAAKLTNNACALFAKAMPTPESAYITALVLFFILTPLQSSHDGIVLALIAAVAMVSKYVIAAFRRHIFNPAALGVFIAGLWFSSFVTWWVATPLLLPLVLIIGLLLVRKLHRFDLLWTFIASALLVTVVRTFADADTIQAVGHLLLTGPLIFFATVLLMDPQTMPISGRARIAYGALVGFLFALPFAIGPIASSPQLALLVGNLFAYIASFRPRKLLEFSGSRELTRNIVEYSFIARGTYRFAPGAFLELALPHRKTDAGGNRRRLAIASAPEDPLVRVAVESSIESRSFERALRDLSKGSLASASTADGAVFSDDPHHKIGIIADGLGIAPAMSFFRHLSERHQQRDLALIYATQSPLDLAYQAEIDSLKEAINLSVLYLPRDFAELSGWSGKSGFVTEEVVRALAPDFKERRWYVIGPGPFSKNVVGILRALDLQRSAIRTVLTER